MITTRLVGGLGNQMFQYAAARALALRLGTEVALDTQAFDDYKVRVYELDKYSIQAEKINYPPISTRRSTSVLRRICRRFGIKVFDNVYYEKCFSFDSNVLVLKDGVCLDGYWQSERYFKDYADEIRAELTSIYPPSEENRILLDRIGAGPSVSMHIRRGDYVSNQKANAVHGTCDLDYYYKAAQYLVSRLEKQPVFYIFSDDQAWVRDNLNLPYEMIFLSHNNFDNAFEDLRLMSNCSHHVIANSSFSWWGAWLNPSSSKIVVAPAKWFRDESVDTSDLIPRNWVRI